MKAVATEIPGLMLIQSERFRDDRGEFLRWFCADELASVLGGRAIMQANHSLTRRSGSLRGLHYQRPPYQEIKLVRCLRGKIFDVVVDLRHDSPTFLQWRGFELDDSRDTSLLIPEGCAHGFQTMADNTELLYLHTSPYTPSHEAGIRYDDPRLGIDWPMSVTDISQRDRNHPLLNESFEGFAS